MQSDSSIAALRMAHELQQRLGPDNQRKLGVPLSPEEVRTIIHLLELVPVGRMINDC